MTPLNKILEEIKGRVKHSTDGNKTSFKKAHSPEIIAMLEPEQLLANEAVRELVEAVKSTHMECWCSHDHVDCIKHDALAKFQKGGGE